jgi:hypothetical protein
LMLDMDYWADSENAKDALMCEASDFNKNDLYN